MGRGTWWCRDCSFLAVNVSVLSWNVCLTISSEVLLHRDAPEGSCKLTWIPFALISWRFLHQGGPKWCKLAVPRAWKGARAGRLKPWNMYVKVNSEHLRHARLFGSTALALASFHDDQKVVENIYTNRLWAAVLMKHLCTRQNLNCPKMGHMCFINTPLWRSGE